MGHGAPACHPDPWGRAGRGWGQVDGEGGQAEGEAWEEREGVEAEMNTVRFRLSGCNLNKSFRSFG